MEETAWRRGSRRLPPLCRVVALLAAALLPWGCNGDIEREPRDQDPANPGGASGGASGPGRGDKTTTPDPGSPATGTNTAPGGPSASGMPLRLNRLSRDEYANTLRDLLGDPTDVTGDLPVDGVGDSGFVQPGTAGVLEIRRYMDLAEQAATRAARDLPRLMGCDLATNEQGCVASFLPSFARRVYRRPPTTDELLAINAHYKSMRARPGTDAASAVRSVISVLLQSPGFLYRWELGPRPAPTPKNGTIALGGYELASRLSYFLWRSMPDDQLFAAAESGALANPAELVNQARRLLASPQAKETVAAFYTQWLDAERVRSVEKDGTVYKGFTDDIKQAMYDETRSFIQNVYFDGDAKLDTLFGGSFSFVNEKLAKVYGMATVKGANTQKVDLDPAERFGLLTQGSFLAVHAYPYDSAPVKRGVAIRQDLLCQAVPAPPPGLMINPPEPDPKKSVREQFVAHSTNPACAGCHAAFNPLGFAFENYDGIGKYRTTSGGKPVDASGKLTGLAGGDKPFTGLREMVAAMRAATEFKRCVSSTWLRYAIGRRDGMGDAASVDGIHAQFERSGFDLKGLALAVVESSSFRFRTPSAGEVLQ